MIWKRRLQKRHCSACELYLQVLLFKPHTIPVFFIKFTPEKICQCAIVANAIDSYRDIFIVLKRYGPMMSPTHMAQ